ncbi:MAG: hypothetical protein M1361_02410 [Patescibacteria group bacterium]|nr:hypothetical protein [Patescibacteria group bacterium]MCL5224430.1 hypothetical protein [Patescibacteria group bacterium]
MVGTILLTISYWFGLVVPWVVFVIAAVVYSQRVNLPLKRWSKALIVVMFAYYLIYALLNTVGQYAVWAGSADPLTKYLADAPLASAMKDIVPWYGMPLLHAKFGYIIFYSWGRFWMGAVLAVVAALVFGLILKLLQKYQGRFFEAGEVELGVLAALLVGWPGFVVFLPILFLAVVLVSIFRLALLGEAYTTLGLPMLFAVLLFLVYGSQLLAITGLQVLKA